MLCAIQIDVFTFLLLFFRWGQLHPGAINPGAATEYPYCNRDWARDGNVLYYNRGRCRKEKHLQF